MDDFVRQSIVENSAPWRPPYPWGNLPPRDDVRTLARDWTSDRIAAIEANCGVVLRAAGILRKTPAGTWQFTTGLTPGQPFILLQDEPGALPFAVLTGVGLLGDLRPPIAVATGRLRPRSSSGAGSSSRPRSPTRSPTIRPPGKRWRGICGWSTCSTSSNAAITPP